MVRHGLDYVVQRIMPPVSDAAAGWIQSHAERLGSEHAGPFLHSARRRSAEGGSAWRASEAAAGSLAKYCVEACSWTWARKRCVTMMAKLAEAGALFVKRGQPILITDGAKPRMVAGHAIGRPALRRNIGRGYRQRPCASPWSRPVFPAEFVEAQSLRTG